MGFTGLEDLLNTVSTLMSDPVNTGSSLSSESKGGDTRTGIDCTIGGCSLGGDPTRHIKNLHNHLHFHSSPPPPMIPHHQVVLSEELLALQLVGGGQRQWADHHHPDQAHGVGGYQQQADFEISKDKIEVAQSF